jgi:hypothetical protein
MQRISAGDTMNEPKLILRIIIHLMRTCIIITMDMLIQLNVVAAPCHHHRGGALR